MRNFNIILAAAALAVFSACNNSENTSQTAVKTDSTVSPATVPSSIELVDMQPSPSFPDARLNLSSAATTKAGDSAKVNFIFEVRGYKLKDQTDAQNAQYCNNSKDGQHIHFILDNEPYKALYEPKHLSTLPLNSEHYLLCFLSRSYHESLKNPEASVLRHFKIDEAGNYQKLDDPTTPMIFYSRPKGDYVGKDTTNVLLDFYPWNFEPGKDGYAVKADIKNETTGAMASFTLKEWKPQFINGLGAGKCSVTLTILKDGQAMTGPYTSITRTFSTAAAEPLP